MPYGIEFLNHAIQHVALEYPKTGPKKKSAHRPLALWFPIVRGVPDFGERRAYH
jgi:hypothetical protein